MTDFTTLQIILQCDGDDFRTAFKCLVSCCAWENPNILLHMVLACKKIPDHMARLWISVLRQQAKYPITVKILDENTEVMKRYVRLFPDGNTWTCSLEQCAEEGSVVPSQSFQDVEEVSQEESNFYYSVMNTKLDQQHFQSAFNAFVVCTEWEDPNILSHLIVNCSAMSDHMVCLWLSVLQQQATHPYTPLHLTDDSFDRYMKIFPDARPIHWTCSLKCCNDDAGPLYDDDDDDIL